MKQEIEQIIKKNLPDKLETEMCENPCDSCLKGDGFNIALSQINTSLIADEVLKVVKLEIEKDLSHDANHFCKKYGEQFKECAMCYFERKLLSEHLSPNKENKNNESIIVI